MDEWKERYLAWAITDDVSLNKTTSRRLRRLLSYRNPLLKPAIPSSRNTTRKWVVQAFKNHLLVVKESILTARSRITLSFDGWTSKSQFDCLGVFAHYLDKNNCIKNVLLGLRNTYGSHTAEEIKNHLYNVITEYGIDDKLAYFVADSAIANDKALTLLENELSINADTQRLRCSCHVINLVCKAVLYGVDIDCIDQALCDSQMDDNNNLYHSTVSQFEDTLRCNNEQASLQAWRRKGPVGKLHNLVVHATRTPRRRQFFKNKQKEAYEDSDRLLALVVNGGIKWNSTCDMLERAFRLKDAIHLYQEAYQHDDDDPCFDDVLTSDDWTELSDILSLLKPLKAVSCTLQSSGKDGINGSL